MDDQEDWNDRFKGLVYSYNPAYLEYLSKNFAIDSSNFPRASRKNHPSDSIVKVDSVEFGSSLFPVIAGPCGLESREQTLEVAMRMKTLGASIFRGFLWKGRTYPGLFEGVEEKGIPWLIEVKKEVGIPINIEVRTEEQLDLVLDAVDVVQIGARNMQNYELLKAVGRAKKPVILKNGLGAGLDEFLGAAEYILNEGNKNVMLCPRGVKSLQGNGSRFALDLCSFSILKHLTHLPVIGDPTHPGNHHLIIPSISMGIAACGADGLLVEVHPDPQNALTDRQQLLDYREFALTMEAIRRILRAIGRRLA